MKTKGAVLWEIGGEWVIEEIDVGDPREGEVTVELVASGLCHSDHHLVTGDIPIEVPVLGGHEGAGIVTKVGPGVTFVSEGDHVVTSFIPACGMCPPCANGHQNLCDLGRYLLSGESISDQSFRIQSRGRDVRQMSLLGTFSPYITVHQASVVKIDDDIDLTTAALLGCGVATGWGSATRVGDVRPGETVVVIGVGGVGINAVQGARAAGAARVIAIDPVPVKREWASDFGATHTFASTREALPVLTELTWGRMADKVIITVGEMKGEYVQDALDLTAKGGRAVVTAMGDAALTDVKLNLFEFTLLEKDLRGAIFGGCNPRFEIPALVSRYRDGLLRLDGLATSTYKLEEINLGYQHMHKGRNLRGVIEFTSADR